MLNEILKPAQSSLRDEAQTFAREEVPGQLLLDKDAEQVYYPRGTFRSSPRFICSGFVSQGMGRAWIGMVA